MNFKNTKTLIWSSSPLSPPLSTKWSHLATYKPPSYHSFLFGKFEETKLKRSIQVVVKEEVAKSCLKLISWWTINPNSRKIRWFSFHLYPQMFAFHVPWCLVEIMFLLILWFHDKILCDLLKIVGMLILIFDDEHVFPWWQALLLCLCIWRLLSVLEV